MIRMESSKKNKDVMLKIDNAEKFSEFGIRKAWFKVGKDLLRTANQAVLEKPRHGRVYEIRGPSGRRRRHRASRPFESHANLTGRLRKSMQWKVRGMDLNFGYGAANGSAPDYAKYVEDGTKRMDRRPTLKNSIRDNHRNAEQHLLSSVLKEFK